MNLIPTGAYYTAYALILLRALAGTLSVGDLTLMVGAFSRARNIICDGQPPRLFPKTYDFVAGRFRPIFSPTPPPAGERLLAHRRNPAMPSGAPSPDFHWVAASTTRGAGDDARALTPPSEFDDGNPATVWAEGLGGDGRGEFLTARAATGGYAVRGLRSSPATAPA